MPRAKATPADPDRLRDADRSQAAILKAATEEFAEFGLGGARMDRLATRAKLDKKLIYYYFGDKDTLFQAVLEGAYRDIRSAENELRLLDVSPTDALRRLITFTWDYFLAHPEFMTLLNSANLHRARHLQDSNRARELNTPLIETLGTILEKGRREGCFRGGIDPLQLYISIASLAWFYLSNQATLSAIFNRKLLSPKARQERLSHMTDMVLGYVLTG